MDKIYQQDLPCPYSSELNDGEYVVYIMIKEYCNIYVYMKNHGVNTCNLNYYYGVIKYTVYCT